ncbi:MAG: glycosyltransferase family 2 protein [Candidatus Omnitrophica bacterium]|nr:glycosyltransferase family 2 protein [Candidatus Omnitrophota bacterium]
MPSVLKISFIVVNWNTKDLTQGCLESLYASLPEDQFEIILIDNASGDGSVEYLRSQFPRVRIIANSENLGFSRANNQGLAVAKGEYAVLVNSDVVVNPLAVKEVVHFLESHDDVGVAGCNLMGGYTHKIQEYSFGYFVSLGRVFNQFFGLFRLSKNIPFLKGITSCPVEKGEPFSVDWISGAFLAVRMSVYRQIGGLNEQYFFYVEDMEWCFRISQAGWKIFFIPEVQVIHFYGASQKTREQRVVMVEHWYRNMRSCFSQYHNRLGVFIFDVLVIAGFSSRYIVARLKKMVKGEDPKFEAPCNGAIVKLAFKSFLRKE